MNDRLRKLKQVLQERGIDGFLVTNLPSVRYLSGFSGTNGFCLVGKEASYFLTDFRYEEQSHEEVRGLRIAIAKDSLFKELEKRKLLRGMRTVGIEGNYLPFSEYQKLKKAHPRVRFVAPADIVEGISAVKDEGEVDLIKKAVRISDKVFNEILKSIRPGVRELEISAEISFLHKTHGAERDAFETIVASGSRGALPHGIASAKKLRKREFVTLDFGCVYHGYCCDITRTVSVREPPRKLREIYRIVSDAQAEAIEAVKPGMTAKDLDAVARRHIARNGFGKFFRHSLGHGIGLQIHEPPRISSQSSYRLRDGNVITIEPGIYLPGIGGVRIEDDVLIMNGKSMVLNKAPKELLIL
jgi:Xaa-Pro aminopeptidase